MESSNTDKIRPEAMHPSDENEDEETKGEVSSKAIK